MLFIFTLLYLCGHLTSHSVAPLNLFLSCGLGLQRTIVTRNVWKVSVDLIQFPCIHSFPFWLCIRVTYRVFPFINTQVPSLEILIQGISIIYTLKSPRWLCKFQVLILEVSGEMRYLSPDFAVDLLVDWLGDNIFHHKRFNDDC